jgi:preprotein translocase subunit SecG
MTTLKCSEWTLTPWATTDASRQCDTVQSVGTGDPLTMYMAVAVVLLLYNIIILAYLVRSGINKGLHDRRIRFASIVGGLAPAASYFAVKFLPPLHASLSGNVLYGVIEALSTYIGLFNIIVAFGLLAESEPGLFRRSRKGAEYDRDYTICEEHRSTNNHSVGDETLNTPDMYLQMSWCPLDQYESLIESDSSNVPSTLGSLNSINNRNVSTSIVNDMVTRYDDVNRTNIAAQSIQKYLGPQTYPLRHVDIITTPSVAKNYVDIGRRCKQSVDGNGQKRVDNVNSLGIIKLLEDPVSGTKIVRNAIKLLNRGIVTDRVIYKDHLEYLRRQDAILIWILGKHPLKFEKYAQRYQKLAKPRALNRLKSLRLIENTSGFPRLSERGRMVRIALRLAAESLGQDPRVKRGASPVTVK